MMRGNVFAMQRGNVLMMGSFSRALGSLGAIVLGVLALGSSSASAQVANCPFGVAGNGAPKFAVDGMLLVRYAVGLRGTPMTNKISGTSALSGAEAAITSNLSRLDIDGDGAFGPSDALIILRYLSGYSRDAWVTGITFAGNAQRKTGQAVELFLNAGCPAPNVTFGTKEAARLLQQATWGAALPEINRVAGIGATAWLNEQFALSATSYTNYAAALIAANKTGANGCTDSSNGCPWATNTPGFYKQAFEGNDQLRQRVVNALLQILVVSTGNNRVLDAGVGMANYMDMLGTHAFGNFRTLLRDATLHPAMGVYLDMLSSAQENPNENYARELLQLFSIGTVMLNPDGTPQGDANGALIPTYTEEMVQGFSKAFTGWHFRDQPEATEPWRFYWPIEDWTQPMKPWLGRRCPQDGRWPAGSTTDWCSVSNPAKSYPPPHHTGTKTLLQYSGAPYSTLPANQTAQQDVENAIDNIFNHPNVGPFIGRQLIQRLVTSNPSAAYVGRVTAAFNNNGSGVRGDMKAVVRAILTDVEARDNYIAANNIFGKLREPVVKFIHLHRAFGAIASSGYYDVWNTSDTDTLGQSALAAPSVFNYYSPDFEPAGPMATAYLLGPEFEITSTSSVAGFSDFTGWGVVGGFRQYDSDTSKWFKPNYDRYLVGATGAALADNPQQLVDELDLLLTANNLKPAFKANLVSMVSNITRGAIADQRRDRFRALMWQIIHSADYAVQR
jgi:uncharacterized protein (DUF1800 family)